MWMHRVSRIGVGTDGFSSLFAHFLLAAILGPPVEIGMIFLFRCRTYMISF